MSGVSTGTFQSRGWKVINVRGNLKKETNLRFIVTVTCVGPKINSLRSETCVSYMLCHWLNLLQTLSQHPDFKE